MIGLLKSKMKSRWFIEPLYLFIYKDLLERIESIYIYVFETKTSFVNSILLNIYLKKMCDKCFVSEADIFNYFSLKNCCV